MRHLAPVLAWLLLHAVATAQPFVAGQTYFGRNNYIEYRAGDLPVILSSPHDGALTPAEIPDRTWGSTARDTNTTPLALAIHDEIFALTGKRPHVILCHLRRTKLDANREIVEAAQGNVHAEQAWREFQDFISAAREAAAQTHGFAYYADIHGHGHDVQRLELGYSLGAAELNLGDTALNHPGYLWMSTLRTLALSRPGVPFSTQLRGARSLGDLLERRNIPSWPSPTHPSPGDQPFWSGGYLSRTHTCLLDNGVVHGLQIETNWTGVRDTPTSRATFATNFARALHAYLWHHYGYELGALSVSRFSPPPATVLARGGPPLTLTLTRTGHIGLSASIPLAFGGTAVRSTSGDYTASATSVSFSANQSTATLTLTPRATGPVFGDKSLTVALAPSAAIAADTTPLVFTLHDGLGQSVRAAALGDTVSESAPSARFRLSRTQSAAPLTVSLAWSGTALPGAHYGDAPASATFPAGAATLELDVPLVDDGRPAPDRTLTLSVLAGSGYFAGFPASATITIEDDDRPAGLAAWLRGDLLGNVAPDSSGLARHGTTLPANGGGASGPEPEFVASAGNAPAIAFDGVNDTLALPKFTPDPEGAFSLAFFFRLDPSGSVSNSNLAAYGTRSAAGTLHLYLATTNPTNGTVALRTNLPGLSANALDVSRTSPNSWLDGVWRHYALTVSATGVARVYINGTLSRSASGRTGVLSRDELLWLGWQPAAGSSGGFMRGGLRDIRVYERALSDAEVSALSLGRASFASWLAAHGLPAGASATADLDGDGLPLFLEYGLAASPLRPAAAPRYQLGLAGDRLALSFLRHAEAADLAWTIEASDDLSSWQSLARRASADSAWTLLAPGLSVHEVNGHVSVIDSVSFTLNPRRFLRVRVSVP